jgi:hypothetical protein
MRQEFVGVGPVVRVNTEASVDEMDKLRGEFVPFLHFWLPILDNQIDGVQGSLVKVWWL